MRPDGEIQSNWEQVVDNFDDMDLREKLLRGIYAYGFEKPSAIQQRAIMPSIKGERNCFAVAIAKICCNLWFNLNGYLQTRIRVNKNPWQHWIMYLVNISLTTPKGLLPVSKILVSCKAALLLKNPRKMLFKIMCLDGSLHQAINCWLMICICGGDVQCTPRDHFVCAQPMRDSVTL